MTRAIILLLLSVILSFNGLAQEKIVPKAVTQAVSENKSSLCFPLEKDDIYSFYSYIIDLRDEKVHRKYESLFTRYNYEFTGYAWASILKEIISNSEDKDIAGHIFVKGQENLVTFTITQYQVRERFPQFICPILTDRRLLEKYIRSANRHKVKNY
ncbi:MAG: hypothetical protein ACTHJ0_13380 [Flavipsychrobacter sp.]